MPKISIVVPCYNVANYLHRCIDSLVNQTLYDIEIIIVDDGSVDDTGIICDDYAKNDRRIKVIHKRNGGVSAARNEGLSVATGEYVVFCDGDDWMPLDACELYFEATENRDVDVVLGDIFCSWEDKDEYKQYYSKEFYTDDKKIINGLIKTNFYYTYCPFVPVKHWSKGLYGGPWNKAVKRSILIENNIIFDERLKGIYDDVIYSAYVLANVKRIAYICKAVYNYRQLNQSITHTYKDNICEINNNIFKCWSEFMDKYDNDKDWMQAYYANVIRRLEHSLEVYYLSISNNLSIKKRIKELKEMLRKEPYYTAVRKVDYKKLNKRHYIEAWLASRCLVEVLWVLFYIYRLKKRIRYKTRDVK